MGADQTVELMRRMLIEAMLLTLASAKRVPHKPAGESCSDPDRRAGTDPDGSSAIDRQFCSRHVGAAWMIHRMVSYSVRLFQDFHRYLG